MSTIKTAVKILCILTLLETFAMQASGVPPTINVGWDEHPPPQAGSDYRILVSDPDFPDVELIQGSLTWRIWSVDTDNPDNIGDIGDVTAFGRNDYVVRIMRPDEETPGARRLRSIDLRPISTSK